MISSMTGFGRAQVCSPTRKITVEVKSLNSKQLDLNMRVPSFFREAEVEMRLVLSKGLERGKVDLAVTCESLCGETLAAVNTRVLAEYKKQIEEMSRELDIAEPSDWYSVLMRLPDAMKSEATLPGEEDVAAFSQACVEACEALKESRNREGKKLYGFFIEKINRIGEILREVEPFETERVAKIRERLEEQLSRLESVEYDRGRLEQELIFYIEKLDVTEEKVRLRSHLNYFLETMGDETVVPTQGQGKKLGFIAQEIGREINTLGSKSNDARMQQCVVRMKDELEQIKEQVLNVL